MRGNGRLCTLTKSSSTRQNEFPYSQCCGTVMIYSGSGSDFGKHGSGSGSRPYLTKKMCTKSCLFNARSSIISRKDGLSFFTLTFVFYFMLDPDLNPVPEPDPEEECIPVLILR
jgi:hypothetical protein